MTKIANWFSAHGSFTLALSGVVVFFGVVLSCPAAGFAATFSLGFFLFLAAAILCRTVWFPPSFAAAAALAYGFGMRVSSPFLFALETFLSALTATGIIFCFKTIRKRKKKILLLPLALLLLAGVALPCLFYGTPFTYLSAEKNARAYLQARYPDQRFSEVSVYRDPALNAWHCDCSYDYEGNSLSSVVLFGKTVKDGFLEDRMASAQETRRSAIIEALRDAEESVLVEPDGFSEDLENREVIPGVYGVYDASLEKDMRFCITFRREKTQKRDFALAIREATDILRTKEIEFDEIRFVALSAGEPVFACSVTPDTTQDLLMDLIEKV